MNTRKKYKKRAKTKKRRKIGAFQISTETNILMKKPHYHWGKKKKKKYSNKNRRTCASITRRWPRRTDSRVGSCVDRDGLIFDRRWDQELLTFPDRETDLHPGLLVLVNRNTRSHLSRDKKKQFLNSGNEQNYFTLSSTNFFSWKKKITFFVFL